MLKSLGSGSVWWMNPSFCSNRTILRMKDSSNYRNTEAEQTAESFSRIFQSVKSKLDLKSGPIAKIDSSLFNSVIKASVSKCVEFNIIASEYKNHTSPAMFLLSSLRGICEDLIYLTYLLKLGNSRANELVILLQQKNIVEALKAQKNFFEANNPDQPILKIEDIAIEANFKPSQTNRKLVEFWKSAPLPRTKSGREPTRAKMARAIGLNFTYKFIYFATSNFVHFNPHALLRTGWGHQFGPFEFSVSNMNSYYQNFSSFYGAVLFIGFYSSFGSRYLNAELESEIDQILALLKQYPRWPEIITFEEMNKGPLSEQRIHSKARRKYENNPKELGESILQEVQSLTQILRFKN